MTYRVKIEKKMVKGVVVQVLAESNAEAEAKAMERVASLNPSDWVELEESQPHVVWSAGDGVVEDLEG